MWHSTILPIDIMALVGAVLSTVLLWRIWRLVGGRGRIVLIIAFAYISVIRMMVVAREAWGWTVPTAELSLPFWVLVPLGLGILLAEVRRTLGGHKRP